MSESGDYHLACSCCSGKRVAARELILDSPAPAALVPVFLSHRVSACIAMIQRRQRSCQISDDAPVAVRKANFRPRCRIPARAPGSRVVERFCSSAILSLLLRHVNKDHSTTEYPGDRATPQERGARSGRYLSAVFAQGWGARVSRTA